MDFNNSIGTVGSPFSPRVNQSLTGRRSSISKKNPNTSKLMMSESQTSDVIYKTPLFTLETYGASLPVMVTEALTFGSGEVSVRMFDCGWCAAVVGRRVLAWPLAPPPTARELTLPQTDLAHKADLVVLFYEDDAQLPSCVGVSPEGTIRYWRSVGQAGTVAEESVPLGGQECARLDALAPRRLMLTTTTCTTVLLTLTYEEGVCGVSWRVARAGGGWLGGLGRRVSLLVFGAPAAHQDTKLVGVAVLSAGAVGDDAEPGGAGCAALVARGPAMQLWRGPALHEHHLRRALLDACARAHLLPHSAGDAGAGGAAGGSEVTALEVHAQGPTMLLLLLAISAAHRPHDLRYALARVCVAEPSAPVVRAVTALRASSAEPAHSGLDIRFGANLLKKYIFRNSF